jgi:hypothetical protein
MLGNEVTVVGTNSLLSRALANVTESPLNEAVRKDVGAILGLSKEKQDNSRHTQCQCQPPELLPVLVCM